jgi:hypothetical protein
MKSYALVVVMAVAWIATAVPAFAQETGSISGVVVDAKGAAVADAAVRVVGDQLPAGRTVRTDTSGVYRFALLLPGRYTISVDKTGIGTATRAAVVEVGRDTQVQVVLGVAVTSEVTVVAETTPVVDLRTTELNFNYTAETIATLPLRRTYAGLFQLVPGVADNGAFAPAGGASRQDNSYLIDGVNITNPLFGYLATEINALDIVEFNVKRGAMTAASGRASGFVANAATRSGTNQLTGAIRVELAPEEWEKDTDKQIRDKENRIGPAYSLGGPLLRNRLFFYTSGRLYRHTVSDRHNNVGALPDRKDSVKELFVKLTAQPGSNMAVNAGYRHRPFKVDFASIGVNDAPGTATHNEGTNRVVNVSWNWFPTNTMVIEAKYLHLTEESEAVAATPLGFQPAFDPTNLEAMGSLTSGNFTVGANSLALNRTNYKRDEVKITASQYLDFGGTGHQFMVGFGFDDSHEDLLRVTNGWGSISRPVVAGQQIIAAVYYPTQPAQLGIGRTYTLFVQDDITIGSRLTVNAGVLVNRDDFIQKKETSVTFVKFGFGDEVQPRVGVNYNLRAGRGDKVYANYGRFYALEQKSTARALAPQRLFTSEIRFTNTGEFISDIPQANTVTKNIAPGLKPPYQDEFVVGYATPFLNVWSVDAFFMYRDADDFIEDIPTIQPFSTFQYQTDPLADRKYKSFVVEVARRFAANWSMNASYSWSRLSGTYDQDYSGGLPGVPIFNTSSLINDGPGSYTADTFRNGVLSQDRTHVFKLFGTYTPPWVNGLTLGAYLRSQSGTPYEKRGLPRGSAATYLLLFEPAGTNRNDTWTNVDLLAGYRLPLRGRTGVKLEGRVLNLFNDETVLLRDNRWVTVRTIPPTSAFAGPCAEGNLNVCEQIWRDAQITPTTTFNPEFGKGTGFAAPLRFLLTVLIDF